MRFLDTVVNTYRTLTDDHRSPRLFEQETAECMYRAFQAVSDREGRPFFETVSSATGGGKTKSAEALIAHVLPHPVTFVIKEIVEIDTVYRELRELLPECITIAMKDGVHGPNHSRSKIADKERQMGREVAALSSRDDIEKCSVLLTTHESWRNAIEGKKGNESVLRRHGQECLVIVDEDPDLERTFIGQPQDVADLIEVLSDVMDEDEARAYGFLPTHRVVPILQRIYDRMERIKVTAGNAPLSRDPSMIRDDEVSTLEEINDEDLRRRVTALGGANVLQRLTRVRHTMDFLRAASEGRVFYAQDRHPAFHAYTYAVPAQPKTIILDGTADLNGMFAASSHVHVIDAVLQPDYGPMGITYVIPPAEFRGKIKPSKLLRNRWSAEPLMEWFVNELMLPNTKPGDNVLVYAKRDLLSFDLQRDYDQSGSKDPHYIEVDGRCIWFCHFGSGRGSNQWKHCNVCFRLTEFYPQKASLIAKAASMAEVDLTDADLKRLGSGTTTHDLYRTARDTHLIIHNKQETARTCIRQLDDHGVCEPAEVFFVDSELQLLERYQDRMYPGSGTIRVLDMGGDQKAGTQTQQVVDFMLTREAPVDLTPAEIGEVCGVSIDATKKAIQRSWDLLEGRGWRKSTEKAVRGRGRATCYVQTGELGQTVRGNL